MSKPFISTWNIKKIKNEKRGIINDEETKKSMPIHANNHELMEIEFQCFMFESEYAVGLVIAKMKNIFVTCRYKAILSLFAIKWAETRRFTPKMCFNFVLQGGCRTKTRIWLTRYLPHIS